METTTCLTFHEYKVPENRSLFLNFVSESTAKSPKILAMV